MRRQKVKETLGFKTELLFAAIFQAIVPPLLIGFGLGIRDEGKLLTLCN